MPKFFVSSGAISASTVTMTGDNASHVRVLRLKEGDSVTVCDGCGTDYQCVIAHLSPAQVDLQVLQAMPSAAEPQVRCSVYMAYAKSDKLEHVIQKATELGAAEIVAFPTARCVSRPDAKALKGKLERWQKIAASAASQCGRGCIPQVLALDSYQKALDRASAADLCLLPYENEQQLSLRSAIGDGRCRTVSILTGPEGGFEPDEVLLAQQAGFRSCTLGPRILRCETAPLCALTAVLFACGALD